MKNKHEFISFLIKWITLGIAINNFIFGHSIDGVLWIILFQLWAIEEAILKRK